MKKVGILTLPFEPNYGWILQLWALYSFLRENGYEPVVIDRRWNCHTNSLIYKLKRFIYNNVLCRNFTLFFNEKFVRTSEIRCSKEMKKLEFDSYIVGSDQVWRIENTRGADLNYFFDFLDSNNKSKKIAYAASFGTDEWKGNDKETKRIKILLKDFDLVSVREDSGITLCRELFDISAHCLLDPTLLIKPDNYMQLIKKKSIRNFIATYFLDYTQEKKIFIDYVSKTEKLSVKDLYKKNKTKIFYYRKIENWLQTIYYANYVIVDSFHGMCFSIIFQKQFLVVANKKRGLTRFTSLLNMLGLSDRLVYNLTTEKINILKEKIDYKLVNTKIEKQRELSEKLLFSVLTK